MSPHLPLWGVLIVSTGALLASPSEVSASDSALRPNIVVIVADDLGYADVGFNGGEVIKTPNLDRLAATGVNLTNFRACPMCSPTRAGLMTGRWPLRFGMMRAVVPPWSTYALPAEENTLAELLAEAGYERRACIGKWHLGHTRRADTPPAHGFTAFYGHYNGAIDYFTHEREGEVDWHRNFETVREEGYATDLLAAEAARFVEDSPVGKPWLLYLPFNAPHSPFQAKRADIRKYQQIEGRDRRIYAAMVDSLDQGVGRVLSAIESRPDADNTLILFFSDNGGVGRVASNEPWRGSKLTVYEGGTRVCAALRWPAGGLAGGKKYDGRIGYIDVLPTLLAAAGRKSPSNLDGIDVMPAIRGTTELPDRPWFSYMHQNDQAHASVHQGDWKLVAHGEVFAEASSGETQLELYNLERDPAESMNLAADHSDVVEQLQKQLVEFGSLQRPGVTEYGEGRAGFVAPTDWILED